MQLVDVMRRLNTENEICFLLMAYLETLQSYGAEKRLPHGVAQLPIIGAADVELRFRELLGAELCGLARSHCDTQGAIAREATEIFGAAFTRLQALRQAGGALTMPSVVEANPGRPGIPVAYENIAF